MKETICTIAGVVGSFIAGLFGGWDASMATLLLFMGVDALTGIMTAYAGRSSKSQSGKLSSKSCWRGLAKKCVSLLLVLVAARLDITLGTTYIRDAVCIAFVVNELISITENAGLLGVPLPGILTKAIELLQTKGKDE
ncbi:holin family protein [uncultured Ruminococcus sp.]|uniref:phage holin family protein n=1 Tax=uncultured Ruminococcus sp. TaxID=165186 RepID=UPI0025E1891B|nr:phage holin family protein [uncultured Ruminococcus sp.]